MRNVVTNSKEGVAIGGRKIGNLRYADDTVLFGKSSTELKNLLNKVNEESEKMDLMLNTKKTKVMIIDANRQNDEPAFVINSNDLQQVDHLDYLGTTVNTSCDRKVEVKNNA